MIGATRSSCPAVRAIRYFTEENGSSAIPDVYRVNKRSE